MNTFKKYHHLSNTFILSLIFVTTLLCIIIILSTPSYRNNTSVILNDNWSVSINETAYSNVNLDDFKFKITNRGDELYFSCLLPDTVPNNPTLCLNTIHSAYNVFIDNELIYEYGFDQYNKNELVGYGIQRIELPNDCAGKEMTLHLVVTENLSFGAFTSPELCDGNDAVTSYIYKNRVPFVLSIFLVLFGIFIACIAAIYSFITKNMRNLLYISLFSITAGLWSFCNYDFLFLYTSSLQIKVLIEYSAFYLMPLLLFLYFKDNITSMYSKGISITYHILLAMQTTLVIVAHLGQIFGFMHFPTPLQVEHILMFIMADFLLFALIMGLIKKVNHNTILLTGVVIMVCFGSFDLIRFNLEKFIPFFMTNVQFHGSICVGVLIFVIAMLLDFFNNIAETLYDAVRNETLTKLAYTDPLTTLDNRRKWDEDLSRLDEAHHNYSIISIDLNNLKQVNDTLGHEKGDAYICSFAHALASTFSDSETVARIGGDEFAILIPDTSKYSIAKRIEILNETIKRENTKSGTMTTYAYGVCTYKTDNPTSAMDAYTIADKRMYENKAKIKKNMPSTAANHH